MNRFPIPSHTREEIIAWLETEIEAANTTGHNRRPCLNGMRAALIYMRQNADANTTAQVSHGEMDAVIARLEEHYKIIARDPAYDLAKLLNYVKTAALMPKEPSLKSLNVMQKAWENDSGKFIDARREEYNALHEHLTTPPKKKMKTMWMLAYEYGGKAYIESRDDERTARAVADGIASKREPEYTNVSPIWSQEVEDK